MNIKERKLNSKVDHFNNLINKNQNELKKNAFSTNWENLKNDKSCYNIKYKTENFYYVIFKYLHFIFF